jgi:hypothetical protein
MLGRLTVETAVRRMVGLRALGSIHKTMRVQSAHLLVSFFPLKAVNP